MSDLVPALHSSLDDTVAALRAAGCVFAEDEARLLRAAASDSAALAATTERRVSGEPLEHILGWAEFCGRRIRVTRGVFVPRRRTELLVTEAVAVTRQHSVVVDLCCGSGAVGAALRAESAGIDLYATDIDATAVSCARLNIEDAHVYEGDLFAPLPSTLRCRVDVLLANAPYVPTGAIDTMPPEARMHEPLVALDGGSDGLDIGRRVVHEAPRWLVPGGRLLIETSERQAPELAAVFFSCGFAARVVRSEKLDATIVAGTLTDRS
ncbi:putative protein N(5)-glutamine methyltransferase [Antrihabitans spumae]|uniref:peptide chain release factor N(5)-glutamine methyltransferase n=1 Tax=Antrihabitans spumae TaxID=3373370 RepID=A0ABW7K299_9NOCA